MAVHDMHYSAAGRDTAAMYGNPWHVSVQDISGNEKQADILVQGKQSGGRNRRLALTMPSLRAVNSND